jgi:hypothetical protein
MTPGTDRPVSEIAFLYGYRVGHLPPGCDPLDEQHEPRPGRCFSCRAVCWFPTAHLKDEWAARREDPTWKVVPICLECTQAQAADPTLPTDMREIHLAVLRSYQEKLDACSPSIE